MNINTGDIQTLLDFINEEWLMLLFRILFSGIVIVLILHVVKSIASYINLRLDPYLRRGSLLEFNGYECRVKAIKIFRVELEFKQGYMTIPTKCWSDQKYLILKDMIAIQKVKHYTVEEPAHYTDQKGETR